MCKYVHSVFFNFLYFRRLLTEVESFKQPAEKPEATKPEVGQGDQEDHVTYQLYYRPEQAKFSNNARVSDSFTTFFLLYY